MRYFWNFFMNCKFFLNIRRNSYDGYGEFRRWRLRFAFSKKFRQPLLFRQRDLEERRQKSFSKQKQTDSQNYQCYNADHTSHKDPVDGEQFLRNDSRGYRGTYDVQFGERDVRS